MNNYHPCTEILIEGLKRLPGGSEVLAEWDKSRAIFDKRFSKRAKAAHGIGATGKQALQLQNSTVVGMNLQFQDDAAELEQDNRALRALIERLEGGALLMRARMERLEGERDWLLEMLKRLAKYPATRAEEMSAEAMRKLARAAIAKVEGRS